MSTLSKHLEAIADLAKHDLDIRRVCVAPSGIEIEMRRWLGDWSAPDTSICITWREIESEIVDVSLLIARERVKLDRSQSLFSEKAEIPDELPQVVYLD